MIYGTPKLITDGMFVHLDAANPMSYTSGSTSWKDLSGNNNNGTLINNPGYSTISNGGINLNGSSNSVFIPYSGSTDLTYTFNIVMKTDNTNYSFLQPRQCMIGLSQNGGGAFRVFSFELWERTRGINFRGDGGGTENVNFSAIGWTGPADPTVPNVYTVVINSAIRIYVNGVLNSTGTLPLTSPFNSINLGTRVIDNRWRGQCFMFSAWNRELLPAEIKQNFEATRLRFSLL